MVVCTIVGSSAMGVLSGLAVTACLITFGTLMLVPASPYSERNLTGGIVMVVLGGTGIGMLGGMVLGSCVGGLAAGAVDMCCCDCDV